MSDIQPNKPPFSISPIEIAGRKYYKEKEVHWFIGGLQICSKIGHVRHLIPVFERFKDWEFSGVDLSDEEEAALKEYINFLRATEK